MKFYIYTIILFLSFSVLEAQPKFKNKAETTKQISTFGDINFETELKNFNKELYELSRKFQELQDHMKK